MIVCRGVWLPDGEEHLVDMLDCVPLVDGRGAYQYPKLVRAMSAVRQWECAIDVGAHVGLWTMRLVKLFRRVECFEPIPAHRECWWKNLEEPSVGVATMHVSALGNAPGVVSMAVTPGSSGDTYVVDDGTEGALTVERRTLDSYGFEGVGFIKIDCEGYERHVLEGGIETIKRERPAIIVEQKPGKASRYGLDDTSAVPFLRDLGMRKVAVMNGDFIMRF